MLNPEDAPDPGLGTAVGALVLGLVALLLSPLLLGLLLAPAGLVLAMLHRRRGGSHGTMALWGGGLAILGLLASLGLGAFYYQVYRQYQQYTGAQPWSEPTEDDHYAELEGWHGVAAPATVFKTVDGKAVDLESLKGRRVVVNVWATWCAACVREIPHFDRLARETPQNDLVILGLSEENAATVKAYGQDNHLSYALAADASLGAPFGTPPALPTTFFIDRKGVIQRTRVGYMEFDELKAQALGPDFEKAPAATSQP
jgi:peroxiredoxin